MRPDSSKLEIDRRGRSGPARPMSPSNNVRLDARPVSRRGMAASSAKSVLPAVGKGKMLKNIPKGQQARSSVDPGGQMRLNL